MIEFAAKLRSNDRGLALLSVLWVTAVMAVILYAFARSMTTQARIARNALDQVIALELAKSGVERAIAELNNDSTPDWDDEEDEWFGQDDDAFKEVKLGAGAYSLIRVNVGLVKPDAGDEPAFGLADEGGKLDINHATRDMIAALPVLQEHNPTQIADAIIDWRDEDETPGPEGAESLHYQALPMPYACKNAPFETVEELLLVNGVTRELLYGEDANRNGVLDANENDGDESPPDDDADGELDRGLIDFVTVYAAAPAPSSSSSSASAAAPASAPGANPGAASARAASQPAAQTSDASELRVNVYTASKDVLMCLPGMNETLAEKLVESRGARSGDKSDLQWVAEAVGQNVYDQIRSYLAVRSDVFVVDSVGRVAGKPIFRRVRAIIDRRNGSARVVYWRDITSLGPPFPFEEEDREQTNP